MLILNIISFIILPPSGSNHYCRTFCHSCSNSDISKLIE
uniref:Uncharacterized protein n=1 Tax=Podoviridae sp. ct8Lf7 TaxID=2827723 RepID=A0A8S5S0L5_9CAUD|nr:MAG TPA: hypothetical protein [Podoviridae sp. ct8Lf7]